MKVITCWKEFCRDLQIPDNPDRREALALYIEVPYFEASWKHIALSLYHCGEENAVDALFQFMKSAAG